MGSAARGARQSLERKIPRGRFAQCQINFGLKKIREVKAIESGDAATMGIGIITPERWKKTRDFLVEANLLKASTDTAQSITTEFIKDVKVMM